MRIGIGGPEIPPSLERPPLECSFCNSFTTNNPDNLRDHFITCKKFDPQLISEWRNSIFEFWKMVINIFKIINSEESANHLSKIINEINNFLTRLNNSYLFQYFLVLSGYDKAMEYFLSTIFPFELDFIIKNDNNHEVKLILNPENVDTIRIRCKNAYFEFKTSGYRSGNLVFSCNNCKSFLECSPDYESFKKKFRELFENFIYLFLISTSSFEDFEDQKKLQEEKLGDSYVTFLREFYIPFKELLKKHPHYNFFESLEKLIKNILNILSGIKILVCPLCFYFHISAEIDTLEAKKVYYILEFNHQPDLPLEESFQHHFEFGRLELPINCPQNHRLARIG